MKLKKERKIDHKLTKKMEWVLFVVIFCIAPYMLRLILCFAWREELEGFYVSEMDLFSFSLAVSVALFAEIKNFEKLPWDLGEGVFYGFLMFYVITLFVGIGYSLEYEHRLVILKEEYKEILKIGGKTKEVVDTISLMEIKKLRLYLGSILAAITTAVSSYRIIFKING